MFKNKKTHDYLTISLIAIIVVMLGTLATGQLLQPSQAQTTAGQIGQKVGQAAEKVAGQAMGGNQTGNQTGNQSAHPLAKIGALKGMLGGK